MFASDRFIKIIIQKNGKKIECRMLAETFILIRGTAVGVNVVFVSLPVGGRPRSFSRVALQFWIAFQIWNIFQIWWHQGIT